MVAGKKKRRKKKKKETGSDLNKYTHSSINRNGAVDDQEIHDRVLEEEEQMEVDGSKTQYDVEEYLSRAEELLGAGQVEKGVQYLQIAKEYVRRDDAACGCSDWYERLGFSFAEVGQTENAIEMLSEAVKHDPEDGHEKFMYLAQLLDGDAPSAREMALQGIKILERALSEAVESNSSSHDVCTSIKDVKEELSSALCALAEIHLDETAYYDESGESGDQEKHDAAAEELLQRAICLAPHSAEPLQVLASLKLTEGKEDEAQVLMQKSLTKWRSTEMKTNSNKKDINDNAVDNANCDAMEGGVDRTTQSISQVPNDQSFPSLEFRFTSAKLLLEMQEQEEAISILEEMNEEYDMNPDVWYLLSVCYHKMGPDYSNVSLEAAEKGLALVNSGDINNDIRDMLLILRDGLRSIS